jgi:hypothetical protein
LKQGRLLIKPLSPLSGVVKFFLAAAFIIAGVVRVVCEITPLPPPALDEFRLAVCETFISPTEPIIRTAASVK